MQERSSGWDSHLEPQRQPLQSQPPVLPQQAWRPRSRQQAQRRHPQRRGWAVSTAGAFGLILGLLLGFLAGAWRFGGEDVSPASDGPGVGADAAASGADMDANADMAADMSEQALAERRDGLAIAVVELAMNQQSLTATASELGISLDDSGDIAVDTGRLQAVLRSLGADPETPRIVLSADGVFEPVLDSPVPLPDVSQLASLLEVAVLDGASGGGGIVNVTVPTSGSVAVDPAVLQSAADLAAQANEISADGIRLRLEGTGEVFEIKEAVLRNFLVIEGQSDSTHLAIQDRISSTLSSLFAGYDCCHPAIDDIVMSGLLAAQPTIVLPAMERPHPLGSEQAETLGVADLVGEFTTYFKAGQSRVTNIARMAELTRGTIIEPGGQFSVNDHVGPLTTDRGFVPGGAILNGVFVEAVGGGVSQYATTLFNAAFFAGLDFVEYRSHSIYISRYPYGREATLARPRPDLVIRNNTPYKVLIWPTTTDTSITARLYSTAWVVGIETGQASSEVGASCTRVTTERTRTWLSDSRTATDTVTALYRPKGLKCDGTSSVPTTTAAATAGPDGSEVP